MPLQSADPFYALAQSADDQIDLARGALLIAQDAYPELDLEFYLEWLDRMAADLQPRCADACTPMDNLELLNDYLFTEQGFTGNTDDYSDPRNSYLNDVLERRTGIPITLSVVYLEVGRRLGLPLVGVNFPGHFLVRYQLPEPVFIDPFAAGRLLSPSDLGALANRVQGKPVELQPHFTARASTRGILARMLRNLEQIHLDRSDHRAAIRAAERITWLLPEEPHAFRDLGYLYHTTREYNRSLAAFEMYLRWAGEASDAEDVRQSIQVISAELGMLN